MQVYLCNEVCFRRFEVNMGRGTLGSGVLAEVVVPVSFRAKRPLRTSACGAVYVYSVWAWHVVFRGHVLGRRDGR